MKLIKKNNGIFDDRIFEDWFHFPLFRTQENQLRADVKEEDDKYIIEIDIPGYTKEDVRLSINDGHLSIEAIKNETKDTSEKNYIRKERFFGKASRSFYVGNIKEDKIFAQFRDGILTINVPKESQEETKKYISIE